MGTLRLQEAAIERFNSALLASDPQRRQVNADLIASAARALYQQASPLPIPASIYDRLRCVALLRSMLGDHDWETEDTAAAHADTVLSYVLEREDLIPHDAPVVGHLDDAILTDVAWPGLLPEVGNYLDYRRLRRLEAELRGLGSQQFRFRREDWLDAREAEQRWQARMRQQGLERYRADDAARYFRVH